MKQLISLLAFMIFSVACSVTSGSFHKEIDLSKKLPAGVAPPTAGEATEYRKNVSVLRASPDATVQTRCFKRNGGQYISSLVVDVPLVKNVKTVDVSTSEPRNIGPTAEAFIEAVDFEIRLLNARGGLITDFPTEGTIKGNGDITMRGQEPATPINR